MSTVAELLARIVAIQKEIDTDAGSTPYLFHKQAGFPYWTNRMGRTAPLKNLGSGMRTVEINVEMFYHIGLVTGDSGGVLEAELQQRIITTLLEFEARPELISAANPDPMNALVPALSIASRGVMTLPTEQGSAIGTIFDLTARLTAAVETRP